jgi:hypothetical protein
MHVGRHPEPDRHHLEAVVVELVEIDAIGVLARAEVDRDRALI